MCPRYLSGEGLEQKGRVIPRLGDLSESRPCPPWKPIGWLYRTRSHIPAVCGLDEDGVNTQDTHTYIVDERERRKKGIKNVDERVNIR